MKRRGKRGLRIVPKAALGAVAVAVVPSIVTACDKREALGVADTCFNDPGRLDCHDASVATEAGTVVPDSSVNEDAGDDASDASDASDDGDVADVGID